MLPENMDPVFRNRLYAQGDHHRIYYGDILGTFLAD
jgi:hypothetical protein